MTETTSSQNDIARERDDLRILYASRKAREDRDLPPVFRAALEELGRLRTVVDPELSDEALAALIREHDVYLISRASATVPEQLANNPGRLRLVQAVVGSLRAYVPRGVIAAGIPTSNWWDAPADGIAEGTLTLLLAVLSDLHHHIMEKRRGAWRIGKEGHGGSLFGQNVGLYGFGFIGRRFAELLEPFGCSVHVFDPYVEELPASVRREESLEALFDACPIISIHAGLTEETRGSVDAALLSRLPDHGVIVNTGRGDIIDQEALFAELESGRLRAGLDVLAGTDTLEPEHPARSWENLILTSHQVHMGWPLDGRPRDHLSKAETYGLENLRALRAGGALQRLITTTQFDRMT